MSQRRVDLLDALIHENAKFVHMGATMNKAQELEVIATGYIHYKDIDIEEVSLAFVAEDTAIVLNKITLGAVVEGHEVTNPFVVTEVYVHNGKTWLLGSLSFTRLVTRPDASDEAAANEAMEQSSDVNAAQHERA